MHGPIALFGAGEIPSRISRKELMAATRVSPSGSDWIVHTETGTLTVRPFASIMSETYRLYQTVVG
jgi:hypothetical protein